MKHEVFDGLFSPSLLPVKKKLTCYSRDEDQFILDNIQTLSHKEIAKALGRSLRSIESRIGKIGLRKYKTKPFTKEEDEIIRASAGRTSVEVGKEIGRAPGVVRMRAKRLGLGSWFDFSGGYKDFRGYKVSSVKSGDGVTSRRIPEHRQVMMDHLGRELTEDERVHHINMRKRDNWIDNLYLCKNDLIHKKAHHSLNPLVAPLLESGAIWFDRDKGIYRLGNDRD